MLASMTQANSPLDSLWREYRDVFQHWDDLTLARWLSQTLGQFDGRVWRIMVKNNALEPKALPLYCGGDIVGTIPSGLPN